MRSLTALSWRSADPCELCRRDKALPESRLCGACTETIVRLVVIRERIREEYLSAAARAKQADEYKNMARSFAPFWA
jgi:hypothetical protein